MSVIVQIFWYPNNLHLQHVYHMMIVLWNVWVKWSILWSIQIQVNIVQSLYNKVKVYIERLHVLSLVLSLSGSL